MRHWITSFQLLLTMAQKMAAGAMIRKLYIWL
jgi:hypothetical protein